VNELVHSNGELSGEVKAPRSRKSYALIAIGALGKPFSGIRRGILAYERDLAAALIDRGKQIGPWEQATIHTAALAMRAACCIDRILTMKANTKGKPKRGIKGKADSMPGKVMVATKEVGKRKVTVQRGLSFTEWAELNEKMLRACQVRDSALKRLGLDRPVDPWEVLDSIRNVSPMPSIAVAADRPPANECRNENGIQADEQAGGVPDLSRTAVRENGDGKADVERGG
jgi:hypothetical protein